METRRTMLAVAGAAAVSALQPAWAQPRRPIATVATFSVLEDVVRVIAGARADVSALVGANQDAHVYSAKPGDARRLARAQLLVRNGMGFEGWLDRLTTASGFAGRVVTASDGVNPIMVREGLADPHVWQSFANAKIYARNVAQAFAALSPADASVFNANRAAFEAEVDRIFAEARALLQTAPAERGLFLVPHNSFRYMGRELGLTFRGLRALNTGAQPSAKDLATLVMEIRKTGAAVAFLENITDQRLITQIAAETGVRIGGKLYSDALSEPSGPAGTYLAMLRHNARTLAHAARDLRPR
jgi:zinc/manganese transport system substrate-binding protein